LSNTREYLANAARCFERAGLAEEAARCHLQGGAPEAAAPLYEALDTVASLLEAARCYRMAGQPAAAARCWDRLGRYEQSAADWYSAGDQLNSGWALIRAGVQPRRCGSLFQSAACPDTVSALRRDLGLAVVAVLLGGELRRLAPLLNRAGQCLRGLDAPQDGADLERDSVLVADLAGRPDLAAEIFAAAWRAAVPGAAGRWSAWAQRRGLGQPGCEPRP
jgi:hypothetical protein